MYFNKYPFSQNYRFSSAFDAKSGFEFKSENCPLEVRQYGDNIFRLTVTGGDWATNHSQVEFNLPEESSGAYKLDLGEDASIRLVRADGAILLDAFPKGAFGKNGQASMFRFQYDPTHRFYGAGSKLLPLELSGVQTKFWNTDVWGDFPMEQVLSGRPDPYYVSIPYVIIKTANGWAGLMLNNPEAAFLSVGAQQGIETFASIRTDDASSVCIGAESGQPDLFVIAADSLAELTRTYQKLVGVTPLPPLWSLGYQQCRWGYESVEQLKGLQTKFEAHSIPVDGLWLDIDYMDGFRVFTTDLSKIPHPAEAFTGMLEAGHPVVPIIDPGVKLDPNYAVYQSGKEADVFCKNPEGEDFVGLVWPGLTVFPDFSRESAREWWAGQVEDFAKLGLIGAWLDMNDPSVGKSNPYDMLWGEGGVNSHGSYHNQYGMGMAKATRAGFERAHPDQRIFLLTRSNFLGGGQYAAVWTGDNVANYHYLRMSIPTSLNLALSGIPFNGGDVGGFGFDTNPALLRDWMKATFLGAFFRNHSGKDTLDQEPWALDTLTLEVCRHFIQLRYLLMPYLYNLFVAQSESGEAIMRPLIYEFESTEAVDVDRVDDAYMTGEALLLAPFVDADNRTRDVPLPGGRKWYAPFDQTWHQGDQILAGVTRSDRTTPLYIREATVLSLRRDSPSSQKTHLNQVDLLIVANAQTDAAFTYRYVADDGRTLAYQRGERSSLQVEVVAQSGILEVTAVQDTSGYGEIDYRILLMDTFTSVRVNGEVVKPHSASIDFGGVALPVNCSQ